MYKLKQIAKRGSAFAGAVSLLAGIGSSAIPVLVHADSLNPLTKRSLTLSSSSPGWAYTDGSGNTTYAPPSSGANGKKSGETFSFNVSTDSSANGSANTIKAFTFQYCTGAAGECQSPGDDSGNTLSGGTRGADDTGHADLNAATSSPSELTSGAYSGLASNSQTVTGDDGVNYTYTGLPKVDNSQGNFVVLVGGAYSSGWSMSAKNEEDSTTTQTGKNNLITLTNSTGINPASNESIQVIFYATNTNYITNPGSGAFFVKINDFNIATDADNGQADDGHALDPLQSSHIVDGGVTVANVMNQSIAIQTKVLETMQFSVGTVNPDTLTDAQLQTAGGNAQHSQCDPIMQSMDASQPSLTNVLSMGDSGQEDSLSTAHTYSTHSYWRLSSNSSAGATVYYSGNTLANTEGDEIAAIGTTAKTPLPGSPQFGLALDNGTASNYSVDFSTESTSGKLYEQGADGNASAVNASFTTDNTGSADVNQNKLAPLVPTGNSSTGLDYYGDGTGTVNKNYNATPTDAPTTKFAFDANSTAVPAALATESNQVVDCVTAKMRYVANIAATTPAGIYTTKINYIAAPQY